jgi:DNA polymerase-3 subunit beta
VKKASGKPLRRFSGWVTDGRISTLRFAGIKSKRRILAMYKIGMISLGCPKNQVDAERMLAQLDKNGFQIADCYEGVDAVIINTCGFIDAAKQEAIENILEMAATDGNRLARAKEFVKNEDNKEFSMIVPSKVLNEYIRMTSYIEEENVIVAKEKSKIIFQTGSTKMISRLMEGQYPKYNQLIPTSFGKQALVSRDKLISALEIVSTMINDKTSIVKFEFTDGILKLNADCHDAGTGEDKIEISYSGEDMLIAFNYRYLLEFLKIAEVEEILVQMNTNLSAAVLRPKSEEDYLYLIMPVQIRV